VIRVGVNLCFLVPGEQGGMEIYARELVERLAARDDLDLVCFLSRETAEAADGPWGELVPAKVAPVRARNRAEWVLGDLVHVPRMAARAGCHVVHSMASTAPWTGPFRRVTTIHDLNYAMVPDTHFGVRGLGMRVLVPMAARRSHRIVVDAASTRDDLVAHLHVDPAKIDVVPLGLGTTQRVAPAPEAEVRAAYDLGDRRVLLSVSAKRPHKNLARLITALAAFEPAERPVLVLPGYPTPHEEELRAHAEALGVAADVRFPAWVGAAELEGLYAIADAFVFPSLYEGFGLPVLEAMARGVPVACSDRSSLPEVAGDAALLFDPEDDRAIAGAVRRLLADRAEADRLRAAGRAQAARFSWERTAELTAAVYRRAASSA
jgi:glycosyltransferase involved in cell wall biosynthesis